MGATRVHTNKKVDDGKSEDLYGRTFAFVTVHRNHSDGKTTNAKPCLAASNFTIGERLKDPVQELFIKFRVFHGTDSTNFTCFDVGFT